MDEQETDGDQNIHRESEWWREITEKEEKHKRRERES
jgi:hypothetical protein